VWIFPLARARLYRLDLSSVFKRGCRPVAHDSGKSHTADVRRFE
jgi:hypothetical protein